MDSYAATGKLLALPGTKLAQKVFAMVKSESPEYLHNHCVRVYLFAEALGLRDKLDYDSETLFLACMMHDLGILKKYWGPTRFEVDGADAAVRFLGESGVDEKVKEVVWDAIALHATSHIPMRKRPEVRLVHMATSVDTIGQRIGDIQPDLLRRILEEYPRHNLKQKIIDDFIDYLKANPAGGAGYWLSQIAEKHIPNAPHFNFETALRAAPFSE